LTASFIEDPFGYSRDRKSAFTPGQVAQIFRVSVRQVLLWAEQGIVTPTIAAQGRGKPRLFDRKAIGTIAVSRELHRLGLAPRYIRSYIESYLAECERHGFKASELPTSGDGMKATSGDDRGRPVQFTMPGFLLFSFAVDSQRGQCQVHFSDIGPGVPDRRSVHEPSLTEQLTKRMHESSSTLFVNLSSLYDELETGIRELHHRLPDDET